MSQVAEHLKKALETSRHSVESLAEATKIPRTTILALLDEPISCILPERVYLRGHLGVLADELGASRATWLAAFDSDKPVETTEDLAARKGLTRSNMAMVAGLSTVAIAAVVVAFASALS